MKHQNLHYFSNVINSWMTRLSLLIVMMLIGASGFAQQSGTVYVETNSELKKALDNPKVNEISLAAGYYELFNQQIDEPLTITTNNVPFADNSQRSNCDVIISLDNTCWVDNTSSLTVAAQQSGAGCNSPGANATWSLLLGPVGETVTFANPSAQTTTATASAPGLYVLQYSFDNGNSGSGTYNWFASPDITNPGPVTACGSYELPTIEGDNLSGSEAYYDDSQANNGQVITGPITSSQTVWIYDETTNGCSDEESFAVTINPLPTVDAGADIDVCVDADPVTLSGSPSGLGGTWSGSGVSGSSFDPSVAGVGTHTLTYTYEDVNGCENSDQLTATVNALPTVDAGADFDVCVDAGLQSLSGDPAGGTWTGTGIVSGPAFDPATAGVGTHTLTYTYTDGNGCAASDQLTATVYDLPTVDAGGDIEVCVDAGLQSLSGDPVGGTWTGAGVSGTDFDPSVAGTGTHTITYTYTDGDGCSNSDVLTATVNPLPEVSAGEGFAVCEDAGLQSLSGDPAGGDWTGTGIVSGPAFDPEEAGAGTYTLTYTYTDGNGCTNSDDISVTVYPLPTVEAGADFDICVDADPVTLTTGTPTGGTWTGAGVTSGTFNPAVAGVGTHTLTYTVTDGNQCSNSDDLTVTVYDLPEVDAGADFAVCYDAGLQGLTGDPSGGTWSGTGVSGNDFDPSVGPGTYTLLYSYSDGNGCSNSDELVVTVNEEPEPDFAVNGTVAGFGDTFEFCYDQPVDVAFTGMVTGAEPVDLEWVVNGDPSHPLSGSATEISSPYDLLSSQTLDPGTYTVEVTSFVDGNGCSPSDLSIYTMTIIVYEEPEADFEVNGTLAGFGDTFEFCDIEPVDVAFTGMVTGAEPIDLAWDVFIDGSPTSDGTLSGSETGISSPYDLLASQTLAPGTYEIVMTSLVDGNGCSPSDLSIYTMEIVIQPTPVLDPIPTQYGCEEFDLSVLLPIMGDNLNEPAFYDDSQANGGNLIIDPVITSNTTVWVYDETSAGCSDEISFDVVIDQIPDLEIIPDGFTNDMVFSCGTYVWDLVNNGVTTGQHISDWEHPFTGEHIITYIDVSPNEVCIDTVSDTIMVKPNQLAGQVKYYNEQEGPMPSPFMTNSNNQDIPDYFNVLLLSDTDYNAFLNMYDGILSNYLNAVGYGTLTSAGTPEMKKAEEYYGIDDNPHPALTDDEYYEAAFGFETNVGCDSTYHILVWDGGMVHEPNNNNNNQGELTEAWTWNNWDGVNATDALIIQHMVVGNVNNPTPAISHIGNYMGGAYNNYAEFVADVSNNGSLTALDALLTSRRGVGLMAQFPNDKPNFGVAGIFVDKATFNTNGVFGNAIPEGFNYPGYDTYQGTTPAVDHFYENNLNVLPNFGGTYQGYNYINLYYDATGDINASYQPAYGGFKSAPELQYEEEIYASKGDEVTVPVTIDRFESLGAISLDMDYRSDLIEVTGINYGEDFAKVDEENGRIKINWFDTEARNFSKDAAIAEITFTLKEDVLEATRLFELNPGTELADANANVIEGVTFKTLSVSSSPEALAHAGISTMNAPNPFKEVTNIRFNLPENGKVQILLYDMMGNTVDNLLEQSMDAGQHSVELRANNLNSGVYQYRITLQGEKQDYTVIRSIVVM